MLCRDQDVNLTGGGPDGTLEQRRYVVQNWRHDVAAVVNLAGWPMEWNRYTAYGEVASYPYVDADYDGDGDVDSDDSVAFFDDWDNSEPKADVNRDGSVDSNDTIDYFESWDNGLTRSDGVGAASGLRFGYAGYVFDFATGQYHVRHRVYEPRLGRWTRRDPLGYVDGMGLYGYCHDSPSFHTDSHGTSPVDFPSVPQTCMQPVPNPSTLSCVTASWSTAVASAYAKAQQACASTGARISFKCGTCGGGPGQTTPLRYTGDPEVQICLNTKANRISTSESTLIHELEHAFQMCGTFGYGSNTWDREVADSTDNLICQELGGYCAEARNHIRCEGDGSGGLRPNRKGLHSMCQQACNSIHGEQQIPSAEWSACLGRCLQIGGRCAAGRKQVW